MINFIQFPYNFVHLRLVMGGSQSGPRVITVETGEGETEIKVSQDFVNYISDQQSLDQSSSTEQDTPTIDKGYSEEPPTAQDVLLGSPVSSGKWRTLYEEEKKKNEEYKRVTKEEFDKAANSVKNQFIQSNVGQLVPVSEESKEKVLNCYLSNPKRTLNCSAEVRQYTQCVEKARQDLLVQTLPSQLNQ